MKVPSAFLIITSVSVMCQLANYTLINECVYGQVLNNTCYCYSGFTGDRCNQKCPVDTFGKDCLQKCEPKFEHQTCNHVNGAFECKPGYEGPQCEQHSSKDPEVTDASPESKEPAGEQYSKDATTCNSSLSLQDCSKLNQKVCTCEAASEATPPYLILAASVIGSLIVIQIILISVVFYYKIKGCREAPAPQNNVVELAHLNSNQRSATPNIYA